MSRLPNEHDEVALDDAIDRGIQFLFNHQYPNGEFCGYFSSDEPMQHWCVPESTVFNSADIGLRLVSLASDPRVNSMLEKVEGFLHTQMHPSGTWNFFSRRNATFKAMPYDTDTLAVGSLFCRRRGNELRYLNTPVLMSNRDRRGLFYTFIIFRAAWPGSWRNLRLMAHSLRHPASRVWFWTRTEAEPSDVDMGANANVATYLGDVPESVPVARKLCEIVREGKEAECDRWYLYPSTIHYLVSRAHRYGVSGLTEARDLIVRKLEAGPERTGNSGQDALEAALAISTLVNFGSNSSAIGRFVEVLLELQGTQGEWPRWAYYFGGRKMVGTYGSEELTTACAVEALSQVRGSVGPA